MTTPGHGAALLIDADNLSPPAIAAAIDWLLAQGVTLCVLRAYGSIETLGNAREVLLKHAGRSLVNQGRGTTDVALVVDAMDLLHAGVLPALVAIGSSDGDFTPLALRLRESGRSVICFAQVAKADLPNLQRVYARVQIVGDLPVPAVEERPAPLATPRASGEGAASRASAKSTEPGRSATPMPPQPPAKKAAKTPVKAAPKTPAPAPVKKAAGAGAKAAAKTAGKASKPVTASVKPQAAPGTAPDDWAPVKDRTGSEGSPAPDAPGVAHATFALLVNLPGFLDGKPLPLSDVVMRLRKAGLMGRNVGATAFFRKQGLEVELAPTTQPHTLRWLGRSSP